MAGPNEEQEKWLADAMNVVKQQGFFMKRSLDSNNIKEALKYSASMLGELRTSKLSPQKYYELYVRVFDTLRYLELYFEAENRKGKPCAEFYEVVQHAGNVLPRLYLLCTVGSVYIKSKEAPAKEVLKDLVEMCRGVQHPIRGLFLRSYLTQISKDKLPDTGSDYEGDGGDVSDAIEFLLQNFTEMNKLWVRLAKHQGAAQDKERREKERSELRDLVGKNLHVLSQLDGVDLEVYKSTVLPRILEQIVNCKDETAQYYLMDCTIQVFPDEFHLSTLETLLQACPQLLASVDVKTIMARLMDRLSTFVKSSPEVLPDVLQVDAFPKLSSAVQKVLEANTSLPAVDAISLHVALLSFVLQVHPERLDYADHVLASCSQALEGRPHPLNPPAVKQLVALLSAPLERYGEEDVLAVLALSHYSGLMAHLEQRTNRVVATVMVQSVLKGGRPLQDPHQVELLFTLLKELLSDSHGLPPPDELDMEDFAEEQNLVARLLHLLDSREPQTQLQILTVAESHFRTGGPSRIVFTLPTLTFSALKLVRTFMTEDLDPTKVFQFLTSALEPLPAVSPELALRLYLQAAEAASECSLEDISYDLFTQAFVLYEEDIADSKAQITALHLIIGTLQRCQVFSEDNREALTHKATSYSAKLLKKTDQCRAIYTSSHLFWSGEGNSGSGDGERVVMCLKRAIKMAKAAQQMSSASRGPVSVLSLLTEILNKYLYFFDKGLPEITVGSVQAIVELVTAEGESANVDHSAEVIYRNTFSYIQEQKALGGPRYALLQL